MASSETEIVNSALAKIGAGRILSLDDNSERAKLMKEQYYKTRDALLYSHPWKFALKWTPLTPSADAPLSSWSYQFPLTQNMLRIVDTDLAKNDNWTQEDRMFLCNYDTVTVQYIDQVTDVSKYSPAFSELLAAKLAYDNCYSITQSVGLRAQLKQEFEDLQKPYRSFNAQEGVGDRVYADSWLTSRA